MDSQETLIVGGGLAGLCCARTLVQAGVPCRVLEASDRVGGRVQTDMLEGFLLDRGFQVLLTAYPEASRVFDEDQLELCSFEPGALIRYGGRFVRLVDPWRRPRHLLATACSPVATLADKIRIARLRRDVTRGSLDDLFGRQETKTIDRLRELGFSDRVIAHFFRPFLGGVFLESSLETSSRMFDFVFRMFSRGSAAVPARGMGQLTEQLAAGLPAGVIQCNCRVTRLLDQAVVLESGEELRAPQIVVASEQPAARQLLGDPPPAQANGVSCLYYAAPRPPLEEPILVLNGEGQGPVNNLCVPTQVSRSYGPEGQALISASVLQADVSPNLESQVREQLSQWFGREVDQWRHLRTYEIPFALPNQAPPHLSPVSKTVERGGGRFVCGDYLHTASIDGAMTSGRLAAEACIAARARDGLR